MTERPPGLDNLLNFITCNLDEVRIPDEGNHHPMLVRWGSRHALPAEVCDTCSDPETGVWVPAPHCNEARAKMLADPDCAYTYGVIPTEEP